MKVFIAYKREDEVKNKWVEKFAADLINKYHVDCLIDVFSDTKTVPQFSQRISECDIVVVIVTQTCLQALLSRNGYFSYEVDLAISLNVNNAIRIIPVLREGKKMAFCLSPYPYIDFTNDNSYNNGLLELLSFINLRSTGQKVLKENLVHPEQLNSYFEKDASCVGDNKPNEELDLNIGFETVLNLWEQSTSKLNIDVFTEGILKLTESTNLSNHFTNTVMLEGLYNTFSDKNISKSLDSPFSKIAALRAGVYTRVLLLKKEVADETCEALINAVTNNMPTGGFASVLKEVNRIVPCNNKSRLYWATILEWSLCKNTIHDELSDIYNSFQDFKVEKYSPASPEGYKIILDGLLAESSIVRIHALFRLINWANSLTVEPGEAVSGYDSIQDIVVKIATEGNIAEKLISLIAIRFFVEKPIGFVNGRRIRSEHYLPLLSLLIDKSNESILDDIILAIGRIFQTYCDYRESRNWIRGKNSTHLFLLPTNVANVPIPMGLTDRLIRMLNVQNKPDDAVARMLSLALLRLGLWIDSMTEPLMYLLQEVATAKRTKQEIIIRLTKLSETNPKYILKKIVETSSGEFSSEVRFLAFIGLLQSGHIAILLTTKDSKPFLDDIAITEVINESRQLTPEGYWNGPIADYLRNRLQRDHMSDSGHLIHKLKAKDTTSRWAYYFVYVEPENEVRFLAAIEGTGTIDIEDFGKVVASCYGEKPSEEVRVYLKEKYGFTV